MIKTVERAAYEIRKFRFDGCLIHSLLLYSRGSFVSAYSQASIIPGPTGGAEQSTEQISRYNKRSGRERLRLPECFLEALLLFLIEIQCELVLIASQVRLDNRASVVFGMLDR